MSIWSFLIILLGALSTEASRLKKCVRQFNMLICCVAIILEAMPHEARSLRVALPSLSKWMGISD